MWKRRLLGVPLVGVVLLLGGAEGFDARELACEDAVQHLVDCCPNGAPARALHCYVGRGCEDDDLDLDENQAECLRDSDCETLYASGACDAPARSCR